MLNNCSEHLPIAGARLWEFGNSGQMAATSFTIWSTASNANIKLNPVQGYNNATQQLLPSIACIIIVIACFTLRRLLRVKPAETTPAWYSWSILLRLILQPSQHFGQLFHLRLDSILFKS